MRFLGTGRFMSISSCSALVGAASFVHCFCLAFPESLVCSVSCSRTGIELSV